MRTAFRRLTLAALATSLAAGIGATAGERSHPVRSGESASSIAKRYYGDVELGDFLLRYNGKAGTVIRAGEKLRIPYCEVHRVGRGDSWSSLATKYLGKTQAYPALAALNGLTPEDVLQVGEQIVIPVVLSYQLERGDALAPLAERFYSDPNLADLLQRFNEVDDPRRLSVGETVKIPLVSIRLRKSPEAELPRKKPAPVRQAHATPKDPPKAIAPPKAAAPELPTPQPPASPSPRLDKDIRDASKAFAEGDYARARQLLESLREQALTGEIDGEKADVLRLLAFVYVAFDMRAEACVAYRSLPELTAETTLDPDLVSPKIRETLSHCPGPQGG
jgi:LysM repeat protein